KYRGTPGTGSPQQRIQEQDRDGIDAEVLFPSQQGGPKFWRRIQDDNAYKAVVRAYNGWLAEEYCAVDPDRLIGVGILPLVHDVGDVIAEMESCVKMGLKTVLVQDLVYQVGRFGPVRGNGSVAAVQWVLSGLFDRFPKLKIFFAENQIGWIPFFLQGADVRYDRHYRWAQRLLGFKPLSRPPSEYIRAHCLWGFQFDRVGVELRYKINVEHLIWGSDFPHQESDWPESLNVIERNFAGVLQAEKHKMV